MPRKPRRSLAVLCRDEKFRGRGAFGVAIGDDGGGERPRSSLGILTLEPTGMRHGIEALPQEMMLTRFEKHQEMTQMGQKGNREDGAGSGKETGGD